MSILVPSQDTLEHRVAKEERHFDLLDWFQAVQLDVWKRVDSYFPESKPEGLFLVTGQLLTSEFCISHKEYGASTCEVILNLVRDPPPILSPQEILSYGCDRVVGLTGFEQVLKKEEGDTRKYSIFLETFYSPRIHQFEFKKGQTIRARVGSFVRWISLTLLVLISKVLQGTYKFRPIYKRRLSLR